VVDVQVHFRKHFLHELSLARQFTNHFGAMAHEMAQGHGLPGRTERLSQEACGMQLLQPLGVAHIGLLAGHSFDVPGVNQVDFDARGIKVGVGIECGTCGFDGFGPTLPAGLSLAHGMRSGLAFSVWNAGAAAEQTWSVS
jgi:hypothetical protein